MHCLVVFMNAFSCSDHECIMCTSMHNAGQHTRNKCINNYQGGIEVQKMTKVGFLVKLRLACLNQLQDSKDNFSSI